jgi:hypothetical protein
MFSGKKKSSRKVNVCSTCGRNSRGHVGPQGQRCSMDAISGQTPRSPRTPHQPSFGEDGHATPNMPATPDTTVVLTEMANQIGLLSANMQHMQDGMDKLQSDMGDRAQASAAVGSTGSSSTKTEVKAADFLAAGKDADNFVCLPSGAKVSQKVLKSARNREFINLSDFAPCLEPSIITETSIVDGELQFRPKRTLKNIDSFLLWSMAWRGYEEVLVEADQGRYPQLVDYRIFIQTCAARFWWNAVYSYDVRNRAKKSMSRSLEFHIMDNDIYCTSMDASTTRTNIRQCNRCRSIWHVVKDCPFPEEVAVVTSTRTPQNQAQSRQNPVNYSRRVSQQACYNWNAGRCNNNPCSRLHVCERCGGPDPLPRCKNCNPSTGTQAGTTGQQLSANATGFYPAGGSYTPQQGRMG